MDDDQINEMETRSNLIRPQVIAKTLIELEKNANLSLNFLTTAELYHIERVSAWKGMTKQRKYLVLDMISLALKAGTDGNLIRAITQGYGQRYSINRFEIEAILDQKLGDLVSEILS